MEKTILGIDTGTNSLGWAVIKRDDLTATCQLVRYGDVIFKEGVQNEKGAESSRAAERTSHRSLRKQYFRRRLRKIEMLKVLVAHNLCPYVSEEALQLWHLKKVYPKNDELMLWQRTDDKVNKNPYYARHRCLHTRLDMTAIDDRYTLGRALYHLAQRRGFLSNRLSTDSDNVDGVVYSGISQLSEEMQNVGCEFLGDYFYQLYSEKGNQVRIRTRYIDREEHYCKEFDAICKQQELDKELVEELRRALYFQRPLKSQRHGVGKCTFEPGKPRCADSHPDFEEYNRLCFVNNIQIQSPHDLELRPLNPEEREKIEPLFYRKSKPNFDFEDIAKALAGRNNYGWKNDKAEKPYRFNYRMSQGVPGCPTTAQLRGIFGEDWRRTIAETYRLNTTKQGLKTEDDMVNDVWNVLYSFSSPAKLKAFAEDRLQLDENLATKFSEIKLTHGFASLSLHAIRKILPFLRSGMSYTHAVFFANIPTIVGKEIWENDQHRQFIMNDVGSVVLNHDPRHRVAADTIEGLVKDMLRNNFDLAPGAADKLYHPSIIETYPDAKKNEHGVYQLGSPKTNAIRNPMAMRSLHVLRKVLNQLLREGTIDQQTEVHVEYARELNDANKRKAIADWQKSQNNKHNKYKEDIKKLYYEETHKTIDPSETDVLKFQLWEEQDRHCLYTGKQIGIADFLGDNPKFDIEHTIPQSVGGDSTLMNLTLCESRFNREVKRDKMPSQLANHAEILERIAGWKERYEKLCHDRDRQRTHSGMPKQIKDTIIQRRHSIGLELDYWRGKYERFVMTEVPEGFSRRQGTGIGLISRYAGLYLKSLFHAPHDRNKTNVYTVKGPITAEFRRMWGLQAEYGKKSRDNHSHHCIDAITIACIGKAEYDRMSQYYHDEERFKYGEGAKPEFPKPWRTFTQDVLNIDKELLVLHLAQDNLSKKACKYVHTSKGKLIARGDVARLRLHKDSIYGAIEKDGQIIYVQRKDISSFKSMAELENIVDEAVKTKIKNAVKDKNFAKAISEPIYMNKDKNILIKKVRTKVRVSEPLHIKTNRDLSRKSYKQHVHVANEGDYLIALYEGGNAKKTCREFVVVNNLEAASFFKESNRHSTSPKIIEEVSPAKGLPLKTILSQRQLVLMYENQPSEIKLNDTKDIVNRLYEVVGIEKDGRVRFKHHQEARMEGLVVCSAAFKNDGEYRPVYRLSPSNIKVLVNGIDFYINILGKIKLI